MQSHLVVILIFFLVGILFFPIRAGCGAPNATCLWPPDERGYTKAYYEVEPLGVYIIEFFFNKNIPVYYWSGTTKAKLPWLP